MVLFIVSFFLTYLFVIPVTMLPFTYYEMLTEPHRDLWERVMVAVLYWWMPGIPIMIVYSVLNGPTEGFLGVAVGLVVFWFHVGRNKE